MKPLRLRGTSQVGYSLTTLIALGPFGPFHLKAHHIAFGKGLEPVALDRGMVDKDVGTVISRNKAEPFGIVETILLFLWSLR